MLVSNESTYNTAWVTGASDGIGKALAILLVKLGYSLILSARNEQKLQHVYEECIKNIPLSLKETSTIQCKLFDCNDIESTSRIAQEVASELDIAFLCAGVSQRVHGYDLDRESDAIINTVNFLSPAETCKSLIRVWKSDVAPKKIVIISSIAGHIPVPLRAMYGASKLALEHYIDTLYNDLRQNQTQHIHIAKIIPGFVNTTISEKAMIGHQQVWGVMDNNQKKGISTTLAAQHIVKIAQKTRATQTAYIGMTFTLRLLRFLYLISPRLVSYLFSKHSTT